MKVRCTGYKTSERNFTIEKAYKDNDVAFPTIVIQTNGHLVAATVYNNRDCRKQAFAKCHSEDKFDYETGAKLALKRLFDDIKVISVGDTVKVVDCGEAYTTYTDWVNKYAPEYAVYYKYDCKVPQNTVGTVVKKEQHERGDIMLYLIQTETNACYLIGEKGIKKVQHDYN